MRILVCVKRVPAPGARIVLSEDGTAIDDRHLAYTVSPHEECAVEEAVRLAAEHGGSSTVLTLGPPAAEEQLRTGISMGIDHAVLLPTEEPEWDPRAVATAIAEAVRLLEAEGGTFDLVLFGNESADAANYQVGIRVATVLGRPVVGGVKRIELTAAGAAFHRGVSDGFERCDVPLPAIAAVKEGINVPRYPAMRGRLLARKAEIRRLAPTRRPDALRLVRLRQPVQAETTTVVLGAGAEAAPAVATLLEEVGLL
ncbi:electron transfer flavoprotein beta subunit/FixA family protein [Egicoccus sp. AB-alg2]|uniref:electron transfer flavoprotein subunit beta/FixA family protein n=1 Tax=Egicoccus sp. AB-alg2 TaxID=3242693 RepID=UPI00359F0895